MRTLLPLAMLLLTACAARGQDPEFAARLEEAGFFAHSADPGAVRAAIEADGWGGIYQHDARLLLADAEDLAEGGVESFFPDWMPILASYGVRVGTVTQEMGDGYTVAVDGRRFVIWSPEDFRASESGEQAGSLWGVSAFNTVAMISQLLEAAGAPERAYSVNGAGNDHMIILLTPRQFELIRAHPAGLGDDVPYEPTRSFPWFGQPRPRG